MPTDPDAGLLALESQFVAVAAELDRQVADKRERPEEYLTMEVEIVSRCVV